MFGINGIDEVGNGCTICVLQKMAGKKAASTCDAKREKLHDRRLFVRRVSVVVFQAIPVASVDKKKEFDVLQHKN